MISIKGHKLHINLAIPLPHKYRGGGVAVFRVKNGQPEVLLGLRANNPGRGMWSFPGGGAEDSERIASAAVREFREETGIQLYGRYITHTGIFQIKTFFFEWNTLIIQSTQDIDISKHIKQKSAEFISLRWIPLSELENFKLHRWVKNVVAFYLGGKMQAYTAAPLKENKRIYKTVKASRAKTVQRVSGENLLFDMAEMVLTKIDPDGTKYFKPKHRAAQGAFYGV